MKREIKFKAKRLDGKGWIEGTPICINGKPYGIMIGEKESPDIDPSTVCQFTGLKDCKGNEIWEGDLLLYPNFNIKSTVIYDVESSRFELKDEVGRYSSCSIKLCVEHYGYYVVGNKFDKEK